MTFDKVVTIEKQAKQFETTNLNKSSIGEIPSLYNKESKLIKLEAFNKVTI